MEVILNTLSLINMIPATFWGVVVGSFFTIVGITISNRASDKRLKLQFDHEQTQKRIDREMTLRKEVYLETAVAIVAGSTAISNFANFDIKNDQITSGYSEKAPALAKAHVIAGMKTVETLINFNSALGEIFLKLYARRFELLLEKNDIDSLDKQIIEFGKARDRYLELIVQYNIDGIQDARRFEILNKNFYFEQERIDKAIERKSVLSKPFYIKQLEFMRECSSYSMKLLILIVPVLSAIRGELEISFNEDTYRLIFEEVQAKQKLAIDEFIQKFMTVSTHPTGIAEVTAPLDVRHTNT